ncbi:MAG: hypothetical protein R2790_08940 [Flavobacterium haoranii]
MNFKVLAPFSVCNFIKYTPEANPEVLTVKLELDEFDFTTD